MVENVLGSTFSDRYFGRCLHWRILCDDGRVHYTDTVGSRLRELRELTRIIKNICEKCYISLQAGFRLELVFTVTVCAVAGGILAVIIILLIIRKVAVNPYDSEEKPFYSPIE